MFYSYSFKTSSSILMPRFGHSSHKYYERYEIPIFNASSFIIHRFECSYREHMPSFPEFSKSQSLSSIKSRICLGFFFSTFYSIIPSRGVVSCKFSDYCGSSFRIIWSRHYRLLNKQFGDESLFIRRNFGIKTFFVVFLENLISDPSSELLIPGEISFIFIKVFRI